MTEITRALLEERKARYLETAAEYNRQAVACEGAAQAMDELIAGLFGEALSLDQLKDQLGAREIGEPERMEP